MDCKLCSPKDRETFLGVSLCKVHMEKFKKLKNKSLTNTDGNMQYILDEQELKEYREYLSNRGMEKFYRTQVEFLKETYTNLERIVKLYLLQGNNLRVKALLDLDIMVLDDLDLQFQDLCDVETPVIDVVLAYRYGKG